MMMFGEIRREKTDENTLKMYNLPSENILQESLSQWINMINLQLSE